MLLPTLFFVSVMIFGLQQLLPGDPARALAGEDADPSVIAFLHQKYHLDDPFPIRYAPLAERRPARRSRRFHPHGPAGA